MTKTGERNPLQGGQPFDSNSLKLESLQCLLLGQWIPKNIVEVPSARLPLKTAYLFYMFYCESESYPCVSIQAFNHTLTEIQPLQWPTVLRHRTAQGTVYKNLTLKGWALESNKPPGQGKLSNCTELCAM